MQKTEYDATTSECEKNDFHFVTEKNIIYFEKDLGVFSVT